MLGFTRAKRDVILQLVRLYAYYGKVYPKAEQLAEDGYVSKRTFWRTIAHMEQDGLIERTNRYLNHLQISNAYRLDKLILILARYITEHCHQVFTKHTPELLYAAGAHFWRAIWTVKVRLRDPMPITT
jgi:CTP-dependent riboflavin kinase